jgi:hypothetical protein
VTGGQEQKIGGQEQKKTRLIQDTDFSYLGGQKKWTGREPQPSCQPSDNQWKTSVETLIRLLSLSDNYHEFAFASS